MIESGDLAGAALISAIFVAVLVAAELWRRWGSPKPEWTRKLVHLGGGIVAVLLPLLIRSPWVVLAMALAMSGLFFAAKQAGALKSLHGIERSSRGAEYYPLAVFLIFFLAADRLWLYLAAVLVLAVGDTFAALIGSRYGVVRYEIEDEHKSLEGSLVFLIIAFLAIHLPLLLLTDLPRATSVLAALLVAALVTGFEAISLEGTDNVFVPVAVVFVLDKITTKPVAEIVFQNVSLLGICLAIGMLAWRLPLLNVGGTVALILYAYANWSLGSWQWALPVFTGLLCFATARSLAETAPGALIRVRALTRALLPLFVILVIANVTRGHARFFGPYLAASAVVLALTLTNPVFHLERRRGRERGAGVLGVALLATAVSAAPLWLIQSGVPLISLVTIAAIVLATAYLTTVVEGRGVISLRNWTALRFVLTCAAAGVVLLLQAAGFISPWNPG